MKTSIAILAAAAGLAFAKPEFLNSNFDVVPNEQFVLKFKGCDSGCKIELLNGDPKNLQPVQVLVEKTSGSEAAITLSKKFPVDVYAFRITDAEGEVNYSDQFSFEGTVKPTTTTETTSTVAKTTTTEESSTPETTMVTVTSETETSATPEATTTKSESTTRTTSNSASQTTGSKDNDSSTPGAAARVGSSPVAFAAAVVAVAGYFL